MTAPTTVLAIRRVVDGRDVAVSTAVLATVGWDPISASAASSADAVVVALVRMLLAAEGRALTASARVVAWRSRAGAGSVRRYVVVDHDQGTAILTLAEHVLAGDGGVRIDVRERVRPPAAEVQ